MSFEITMMLFSMGVAGVGIFIAYKCYMKVPDLPARITAKFPALYEYIYNKYFIDELYDAAVVEPLKNGSDFLWHGVDEKVVDGTVNGSAWSVNWISGHLRKLETGFVQNYALAILAGVVIVTGYLIGR
jgi:NADH-quinone oxidoreductase subunit L